MSTEKATEKLFSYGTLRDEKVQSAVFGRLLQGTPDAIVGFRLTSMRIMDRRSITISEKEMHTILRPAPGDTETICGIVLDVTVAELARADRYEPSDVIRIRARLRSGKYAWLYILA
jgi:hypothetical protein